MLDHTISSKTSNGVTNISDRGIFLSTYEVAGWSITFNHMN
jgi:hypothetical protein